MLELDPLSSTLRTSSLTSEPPRKRQRTTDCEPNVATAGTSPAPSPGPFGDVSTSTDATASRSSSTLGWSSRLHTATSPTGNTPESSDVQLGASFVGSGSAPPSGAVAESVSVDAARSGATCQGDLTFVVPNARFRTGGRGNADGSPPSMKGGRKARAKQEYPDDDGGMNREPIQSEPRRHQVSTEGACASDRGFHGTEVGRSNPRDAAGGARAIAASNSPMAMRRQHIVEAVEGPHQIAGPEGEDSGRDLMLVRDGEFYINSADCVIRVEDTLFRVSVALLSSNYSFFGICSSVLRLVPRTYGTVAPQSNTLH
ncbi:hypothetical protein BD311DRAFT_76344 [Dichomitus squalens]|uniref:Uncharacterized protein n=1 Tax=Dichomitus squalens TaxID=114155 RepID=A0A4Q9MZL6_9APHY|nr:hypothetical protein BD311DRAFT_76344 [Dichomitus squalens]